MNLSIIIPVHNGAGYIKESVSGLQSFLVSKGYSFEIILVNDGSSDNSEQIIRCLALNSDNIRMLSYTNNRGKYAAIRDGMAIARGKCKIFTDADIPYDYSAILYIQHLVNEGGFHIVIGDRTLAGSEYAESLPLIRRIATKTCSAIITLFFTGGLSDTQCGLKGFRADVAGAIFPLVLENGFAGDVELLYIALKYNLKIRRIPVRLRRAGSSTVRPFLHGIEMLAALSRLRSRWKRGFYSSKHLSTISSQWYWLEGKWS